MSDPEEDKQTGNHEAEGDQGCPVKMYDGRPCRRPIYRAPQDVDKIPVCLMHSEDPNKSEEEFQREIDQVLAHAPGGVADFSKFVFSRRCYFALFTMPCIFKEVTFVDVADFIRAEFREYADFTEARFMEEARIGFASFMDDAYFDHAAFAKSAHFVEAKFSKVAEFTHAKFMGSADFSAALFEGKGDFGAAEFMCRVDFSNAKFRGETDFIEAVFRDAAQFVSAAFSQYVYFICTIFQETAGFLAAEFLEGGAFLGTNFAKDANFSFSKFAGSISFDYARFGQRARFENSTFMRGTTFRETEFLDDGGLCPGPIFSVTRFEEPDAAVFYKTDLAQALFHNCDVSRLYFSSVTWRRRENGKRMVFDEIVSLGSPDSTALRPDEDCADNRNYSLIAELYQQLKKNYDDRRDYWTAGDFHYGEMEMKRLACPRLTWLSWLKAKLSGRPRLSKLGEWCGKLQSNAWLLTKVRWWHQHFGLAAWYRRASDYGESWGKPLLWLFAVLVIFAALYPLLGLKPAAGKSPTTKTTSIQVQTPSPQETDLRYWNCEHPGRLFWHSVMTSLGIAAFQRDLAFEPSYPWGRLLALLELLLTSTLIALFLLAVRRQFRR